MGRVLGHLISVALLGAVGGSAIAAAPAQQQDFGQVIAARQGQFHIIDYNLRLLEDMVSGKTQFDQAVAIFRALNIQMATHLRQDRNWLPGSDQPEVKGTEATGIRAGSRLFKAKFAEMMAQADDLVLAVGDAREHGNEQMATAVANMRSTCQGCHQFYRTPRQGGNAS